MKKTILLLTFCIFSFAFSQFNNNNFYNQQMHQQNMQRMMMQQQQTFRMQQQIFDRMARDNRSMRINNVQMINSINKKILKLENQKRELDEKMKNETSSQNEKTNIRDTEKISRLQARISQYTALKEDMKKNELEMDKKLAAEKIKMEEQKAEKERKKKQKRKN